MSLRFAPVLWPPSDLGFLVGSGRRSAWAIGKRAPPSAHAYILTLLYINHAIRSSLCILNLFDVKRSKLLTCAERQLHVRLFSVKQNVVKAFRHQPHGHIKDICMFQIKGEHWWKTIFKGGKEGIKI